MGFCWVILFSAIAVFNTANAQSGLEAGLLSLLGPLGSAGAFGLAPAEALALGPALGLGTGYSGYPNAPLNNIGALALQNEILTNAAVNNEVLAEAALSGAGYLGRYPGGNYPNYPGGNYPNYPGGYYPEPYYPQPNGPYPPIPPYGGQRPPIIIDGDNDNDGLGNILPLLLILGLGGGRC